ncbi:hypothetical protein BDZ97DRAFT_1845578 [Flammula alnicola]|nr:hypothetical protein BDZ97DRAFT_1845578 [Flammula alnicola]
MSSEKDSLSTIPQSPLPEAPPAYNTVGPPTPTPGDWNVQSIANQQPIALTSSPPSFRPPNSAPKSHKRSLSSSSTTSLKSKKSWFQFSSTSSTRTLNEVRTTVIGLVRDLVRDHSSGSPAALGILNSCSDACSSHSVSLSEILQDKFIESHSPLYWAIVKRPKPEVGGHELLEGSTQEEPDLVGALLSHCTPLNAETISELRLACLATSDQIMFQRLHLLPQFSSISGADQVILGADLPPDDVTVEIGHGTDGAFSVNFRVPQYHKRMMISKEIVLEFIARSE